jgi:molybdate/tungstate transport system substrate-binding protein
MNLSQLPLKNKSFLLVISIALIFSFFFVSIIYNDAFVASIATEGRKAQSPGRVFVMYAGSLVKIFETSLGPSFQNKTNYTYIGEGKGSVQIANLIVDGFRKPDIFVSVGTIPNMKLVDNKPPLTNWSIKFASAEMVIAYSPKSPFYNELEKARTGQLPWYKVMSEKDFKFGRTDPELDPKGYNMIIAAKLANIYYNDSSIKQTILGEDRNPKQIFPEETLNTILESGQVDAIAAYKHEAISRGLLYITLAPQINLGNSDFSTYYKQGSYTFSYNNANGKKTVFGAPIYFSVTIPTTVQNVNGAIAFVNYLISHNDTGKTLLEKQGLDYLKIPIVEGNISKIFSSILT